MRRVQRLGLLSLAVGVAVIAYSQRGRRQVDVPMRDYSGRSGFPRGVDAARGLASHAAIPDDFKIPAPLRPLA